ncbi:MAG: MFS transporter [Chlamydiota bacterium]
MNRGYLNSLILLGMSHLLIDLILGVWPIYKTIIGLDVGVASLIAGVCLVVGEAAQLLFGYLGTRLCCKKMVLIGLCLVSGIAVLAHVNTYPMIFLIILLVYLGSGAFHPSATGILGQWCENSQSLFITLFYTGGTIGAALSQMVFSWSWSFFQGETLIFLVPVIIMAIWLCTHNFQKIATVRDKPSVKEILKMLQPNGASLVSIFAIQVIVQTLVVALMFLLPDLLKSRQCPDWLIYGGGDFFFVIGAAIFGLISGYLYRHFSFHQLLMTASIVSATSLYLFLLLPKLSVLPMTALLLTMGGGLGTVAPIILVKSGELVPKEIRSLIGGAFMGGATCFAGIGIAGAGLLTHFFVNDPIGSTLAVMGSLLSLVFLILLRTQQNSAVPIQNLYR